MDRARTNSSRTAAQTVLRLPCTGAREELCEEEEEEEEDPANGGRGDVRAITLTFSSLTPVIRRLRTSRAVRTSVGTGRRCAESLQRLVLHIHIYVCPCKRLEK